MKRQPLKMLFFAYVVLMLWLLFGQRIGDGAGMSWQFWVSNSVNLIPGRTICNLFRGTWNQWIYRGSTELLRFAIVNNLGNILMFVPLGYGLPGLWQRQRSPRWFWMTVFGIVLGIETVQLLAMLGSWDVDDLLLNLLGSGVGYWLCNKTVRQV